MREPDMRTSPRRNRLIRAAALTSLLFSIYYLVWRLTSSLNPDAIVFSLVLWCAEAYGTFQLALFLFTVWEPVWRRPRPAPPGLDVDVFITTYNEPLDVLRKTFVAARGIRYPHRTWVLDDGCRDEVRELTAQLGLGYLPREECEHAKAGNLNSALSMTAGDFILQLDADHVPLPHILDRLLGYFDDPKVAFVQSPQDFYNLDSFTHVVDDNGRRVWEEQRIFFDIIQPGKDRWNAAFFCGSCGVIRRAALESIGGFSTQTVTEDMETSLILHSQGWKSVYVAESLAYGLSPGSMHAYSVQRLRWATGSMQVLRRFKPLTHKGLSWAQRICYFDSCVGYLSGAQMAILIAIPFAYFLTGVLPIKTVEFAFLIRFFPYIFLQILAFELIARGRGYLWLAQRYTMVRFPIYTRALATFFINRPLPFAVTPKGGGETPLETYKWQLLIVVATPIAFLWATLAYSQGWIDYDAAGWRSGAFVLNGAWLLWTAAYAWKVVRMARGMHQQDDYGFKEDLPVRFVVPARTGLDAIPDVGITTELGAQSLRFLAYGEIETGELVRLRLPLTTGERSVDAEVEARTEVARSGVRMWEHTCRILCRDLETCTAIELHCLHHAVPGIQRRFRKRPDLFEDGRRFVRERRKTRRAVVRMPAQLRVLASGAAPVWQAAVMEELDPNGAQLIMDDYVEPGTSVYFQIPGVDVQARGVVIRSDPVDTPLARRWVLGVACGEPDAVAARVTDVAMPAPLVVLDPRPIVDTDPQGLPAGRPGGEGTLEAAS
jgi:cellulose synthase (UDP-forming)